MMLLGKPNPALKKAFLSCKEDEDAQSEFWLKMTDKSLPSHYNVQNFMQNIVKEGLVKKMEQIYKICIDKRDNCQEAQNTKAVNYYQDFDLFNIVGVARSNEDFEFINNFQFGKLLTSFVENFAESIEQSDKIRSSIDNIFDN